MTSNKKTYSPSTDFIEYMARCTDLSNLQIIASSSDDSSSDIEVIKELKVNLTDHRCDICCEGEFLVDKLLRYGGLIDKKHKYVCDKCDKKCVHKCDLNRHLSTCSGSNQNQNTVTVSSSVEKTFDCSICSKSYKRQGGLTKHIKSQHSVLTHKCEVCDKVFCNFKKFSFHCLEHSKQSPYVCTECNKRFSLKKDFLKHMKTHPAVFK